MRILIAEDDLTSRTVLTGMLRRNGFDVVVTANGAEALAVLEKPGAPRLAILDWMMPELDGIDVVRRVRALPLHPPPYLIMLTARGDKTDLVAGLEAGANDYLAKPFDPGELQARVAVGRRMVELDDELDLRNRDLSRFRLRMENELRLAGKMQRQLFSTEPVFAADFDVRFAYRPSMSIGGDFFDAVVLPDGRLCLYVGDVSGHGVGPALISTFLKMRTSDLVREHADAGPAAVCRALNRSLFEHKLGSDLYATLFLAIFDPAAQRWRACNCGHPLPILLGADGVPRPDAIPDEGELPLGVANQPDQYGPQSEITWESIPGDVLLLFTDGTYEAVHAETGERCGVDNLRRLAAESCRCHPDSPSPDDLLDRVAGEGYLIDGDDCCVVGVRLLPPESKLIERDVECTLEAAVAIAEECQQVLAAAGWPEIAAMGVRLLLTEYATNIVSHSGLPAAERFHCGLHLGPKTCRLFVRDAGRGWNFQGRMSLSGATLPDAEEGRGLAIVQSIARRIDFARMEHYNLARFIVERDWTGEDA